MTKRVILLVLWLVSSLSLRAQTHPTMAPVSGVLSTATGAPVGYATVTLHRAADSTVVKAEFSDAEGRFRVLGRVGERYMVAAGQVGFKRFWSTAFVLPAAGLALPGIGLITTESATLKELTVTARRPLFERQADRTVVHVADNPLSAGNTALDVLGRSPGVALNDGGILSLQGRQGVLLLLDGKRVPLTGPELLDYLRALPAEQLQSIELITNPSAQYDAQGGAGVIALNLKKDQRLGTNGSLNASYGRGQYGKFIGGFGLNYRSRNLNLYSNYTYANRWNFTQLEFSRQFGATAQLPAARSEATDRQVAWLRSHSAKLGADVSLSARTQLSVALNGLLSQTNTQTANQTQLFGGAGEPGSAFASDAQQDINRPNGSATVNFRHAFADSATAQTLSADADVARYYTRRLLGLTTTYTMPAQPSRLLTGNQASTLTISALKVDFSQPLPRRARLEAGAKVTRVRSDNDVLFERVVNGTSTRDPALSSQFRYDENVNAAYLNLRGGTARLSWQAGLRAEQTNTLAAPLGEVARERHYLQLFPSAQVQRTLNERNALGLALFRRIDRPSYGQVNPLRNYVDAASYRAGNPDLVAQTSYTIELTHTYRQKFSTVLGFATTTQPIVNVVQLSPDGNRVVVNQDVNLSTLRYYSLTLTAPLDITNWWTVYANGIFYYNQFLGTLNGTDLDRGRLACELTLNNSLTLPHGWAAELNGQYNSQDVYGFELNKQRGQVAVGLQKSLLSKQGSLRLNVADIFYTLPSRSLSTYTTFTEYHVSGQDSRVATLAFTYRFGNAKVAAARKRAAGAEEELRRAAGQ